MSSQHSQEPQDVYLTPQPQTEDHGEGNWLVSYADMMTLLVGFFIILMSFATIDEGKLEEVKRSLTLQFGGNYQIPYKNLAIRIKEEVEKLRLANSFVITETPVGVDISFLGTVFFDTGSANIKPAGSELVSQIIPVIMQESKDFSVVIEGHTDDVPVGQGLPFRNNWELSSIRACRVLETFSDHGFSPKRLTALGYADTRPVAPNRDDSGNPIEANRSQNRRVVIKIIKPTETVVPDSAVSK